MLYLLLACIVWSFSWGLIKIFLVGLDSSFLAFARIAFAIPLFLPFLRTKQLSYKNIFILILIGGLQYGLMYLCVIRSYAYLQAYQVALFTTFTPIYVNLINSFYTKKINKYSFLSAFIALLGAASIYYKTGTDLTNLGKGFLLVQAADICFAFGQVSYKHFRQANPLEDKSIYALLFLGALIVTGGWTCLYGSWSSLWQMSPTQIAITAYLGSIATGLSFFWWNKGALSTSIPILAVFNNIKIPLGVLVSLWVFKEQADLLRVYIALGILFIALVVAGKSSK